MAIVLRWAIKDPKIVKSFVIFVLMLGAAVVFFSAVFNEWYFTTLDSELSRVFLRCFLLTFFKYIYIHIFLKLMLKLQTGKEVNKELHLAVAYPVILFTVIGRLVQATTTSFFWCFVQEIVMVSFEFQENLKFMQCKTAVDVFFERLYGVFGWTYWVDSEDNPSSDSLGLEGTSVSLCTLERSKPVDPSGSSSKEVDPSSEDKDQDTGKAEERSGPDDSNQKRDLPTVDSNGALSSENVAHTNSNDNQPVPRAVPGVPTSNQSPSQNENPPRSLSLFSDHHKPHANESRKQFYKRKNKETLFGNLMITLSIAEGVTSLAACAYFIVLSMNPTETDGEPLDKGILILNSLMMFLFEVFISDYLVAHFSSKRSRENPGKFFDVAQIWAERDVFSYWVVELLLMMHCSYWCMELSGYFCLTTQSEENPVLTKCPESVSRIVF